jgi:hypothetical protein
MNYKIQIFSGDGETAKNIYDCKQEFNQLDGTIFFNLLTIKVWIGNFRTRIEAEQKFSRVKLFLPLKPKNGFDFIQK